MDHTEDSLKAAEEVTLQGIAYRGGNPTMTSDEDDEGRTGLGSCGREYGGL